ncbi:MAG: carbonic anhydrase family protein [Chlorobi bacterium]|nr:carbonic anhydrase family protein [Chlorobiota bacterium]
MKEIAILIILFASSSVFFAQIHRSKNEEQLYSFAETENGEKQSPINIPEYIVKHKDLQIERNYLNSKLSVSNLGHTIQFNYDIGSGLKFNNQLFDLIQFHFHTPSEHLLGSVTYPLEMHIVHTLRNNPNSETEYVVIGVLFKEGKENPILKKILDNIPPAGKTIKNENISISIDDFFNAHNDFYYYEGSLTTAPFTETVRWIVLGKIYEASYAQIKKFNSLMGNNARHIQAINGREITINSGL